MMDSRLLQAIFNNDLHALSSCLFEYQNEGNIFEQRDEQCNTILHLAVQLGRTEMVTEIVRLNRELLEAENEEQETPLHQACRQKNLEVVTLLLDSNPNMAYKPDKENRSIFSLACSHGFVEAVELMLDRPWLMEFEETAIDSVPLHLALSRGHTDLVKKILQVRPTLGAKTNDHESSLLHYASSVGEVEIIKMLLSLDPLLPLKHNRDGYTPMHLAVICGRLQVVDEFISRMPASLQLSTLKGGDTVFHLAAKFNRYEIFVLMWQEYSYAPKLLRRPNRSGDTVLHVAVSRENYKLAQYIMYTRDWVVSININFQNHGGQTVLDILYHKDGRPETDDLIDIIRRAGGKTSDELIHQRQEAIRSISTEEAAPQQQQKSGHLLSNSRVEGKPEENNEEEDDDSYHQDDEFSGSDTIASSSQGEKCSSPKTNANKHRKRLKIKAQLQQSKQQLTDGVPGSRLGEHLPAPIVATNSRVEEKPEEVDDENGNSSQDDESSSSKTVAPSFHRKMYSSQKTKANKHRKRLKKNAPQYLIRQSMMRREKLIEMQNFPQDKHQEMNKEALQNTRNTITLVAVLVATVSFAAGLSPPGGVYQDGPHRGKSVVGRTAAFKVFVLSNNIALFISLCIVIVLVSIVPFRRKAQMRLLVFAHRAMWVAVAFMATAYVAAAWVTVPHDHQERWVLVALISTCGGTLGTAFIGLTVKLVEHRLRKSKWRKEQRNRNKEQQKRGKEAAEHRAERIISLQREQQIVELKQEGIISLERKKEIADCKVERIISFNSDYESSHYLGYYSVG